MFCFFWDERRISNLENMHTSRIFFGHKFKMFSIIYYIMSLAIIRNIENTFKTFISYISTS